MRKMKKRIKTLEFENRVLLLLWNDALSGIQEARSENMEIRLRAEQMAVSIEDNEWNLESAVRLADVLSSWREFQERSCTCPACENGPVFLEEEEQHGLD